MVKKIMHLMAEFTYDVGVLTTGGRIARIFHKFLKDTDNMVAVVKQDLSSIHLRGNRPPIVKITNILSVVKELRNFRPEILVIHQYFGTPFQLFVQLVAKSMRIKTIIAPDLADEHAPRFMSKSLPIVIKDVMLFISMYLQAFLADKVYCQTENEVNLLLKISVPQRKLVTIPVPLPPGFEIGTSRRKKNYILAVSGWWSDRKNLHTALRVFGEVIKERTCDFLIVGDFHKGRYKIIDERTGLYTNKYETGAEYKKKIMKLIEKLKLKNRVKFLYNIPSKKLKKIYREAMIFYMPSKSEGFGSAFVEAMASGTPAVAMPKAAVRYIVRNGVTGYLKESLNDQKLAILTLMRNKKLYTYMQRNCLKEAKKYTEKAVARKWEELLKDLNAWR